ncbi:hypothetical protein [Mycolicibacterium brisbanense]|uniref:Uncharacterized protein n=1 Tax=Mycolicibacterium brisbanense TaxID=146020 RepID=A0A100VYC8_9MYCO|nr:hypothetical protein [Mycolicibacterium brisbanense]GAS88287.1 uncharacterized protein RMCB_2383 [Mycolicibacterium brisbanense]
MDFPSARSRTGGISVTTTERGLPLALKIDAREMTKDPRLLAEEILGLCRLAAARAQVARRRELSAHNVDPVVIRNLQLATEDDLRRAEAAADRDDEVLPDSWLRSV